MLHQKAKILVNKDNYKEALDVLMMAEVCFLMWLFFCSVRSMWSFSISVYWPFLVLFYQEAFSLCDPKLIEVTWTVRMIICSQYQTECCKCFSYTPLILQRVDNVPMLQLDIVWCYFRLRDVSRLEVAGDRLNKARLGFERSHGKDSTRFRLLQAARHADLAM
jgi:hypothetical protein